jgi:hypothetical protein
LTDYDDDGVNVVDEYLKRRGWKENKRTREYLAALRDSSPSLYEVSDIVRGEGFRVRDLVRGGDPVYVSEHLASTNIRPWTRIFTRIVTVRGTVLMSGSALVFDQRLGEALLRQLEKAKATAPELLAVIKEAVGQERDAPCGPHIATDVLLSAMVIEIAQNWLDDTLNCILDTSIPKLTNTDGEPFELQTMHYRLRDTARHDEIRAALARVPLLVAEDDATWTWVDEVETATTDADGESREVKEAADGTTILGTITLADRTLSLSVNSKNRARRGRAFLEVALAGLVGKPLIEHTSTEQLVAEARARANERESPAKPLLPPDEERRVVCAYLEPHYRQLLDVPIPVLDGMTPREAVATPAGCDKTVLWLKGAENAVAALGAGGSPLDYDMTWMWGELGLLARRK